MLASGEMLPRKRARDQQADIAGLALKGRVLDLLVAKDPEPDEIELCLATIVEELGPPTGPTRGICTSIRDEWELAAQNPGFLDWLLEQALAQSQRSGEPKERRRGKSNR